MADLNKVMLAGNLTRDPELRHIPSGNAVVDLRLAINRRYRDQQNVDREETVFVSVTVWGKQAENCAQYLTKGSPVLVEGRLKLDEWEKDGQKQSRLGVVADRVQFLSSRGSRSAGGEDYADAPASSRPAAPRPPATNTYSVDRTPQEDIMDGPAKSAEDDDVPF